MNKQDIIDTENETRFLGYMRRVAGCFTNWDIMPETDIDDAMNSIALIIKSKMKHKFFFSPLFITITKLALDLTKDVPSNIRKTLV